MSKVQDCNSVVSKFKLQSCYYIPFRTNTLEKGMKSLIPPAMGEIVLLLFYKDGSGIGMGTVQQKQI